MLIDIKTNSAYVKFFHHNRSFQFIIKKDNEYITLDNVPKVINTYGTYNNIFEFYETHSKCKREYNINTITTRFFDIEVIDKLPDFVSTKQEVLNVFQKYTNYPSLDISVFEESNDSSDEIFNSYYKTFSYYDKVIDDYKQLNDDDDIKSTFNKNLNNIKYIYIIIDHSIINNGLFKLTCKPELNMLTYGKIIYAYTIAYQTLYNIDKEILTKQQYIKNHFFFNKEFTESNEIDDLIYNGNSNISIYNDEQSLICNFKCNVC